MLALAPSCGHLHCLCTLSVVFSIVTVVRKSILESLRTQVLEERARVQRQGGAPRISTQQLYSAVNAQTSVAQLQVSHFPVARMQLLRVPVLVHDG